MFPVSVETKLTLTVALSRKAVDMALAGDTTALKLCLDRIAPPRKGAVTAFELP